MSDTDDKLVSEPTPRKWRDERIAFANGKQVEYRRINCSSCLWHLVLDDVEPAWLDSDYEFRIFDPYRKFREAEARGEIVEYFSAIGQRWITRNDDRKWRYVDSPERYRIVKKVPRHDYIEPCEITYWSPVYCKNVIVNGYIIISGETNKSIKVELCK